jgi:hypothetical protein
MAKFRYFADLNGETIELTNVYHDGHVKTTAEHFIGRAPDGSKVQATRVIQYKAFPSKHECDARCINATGRIMKCECSCGGKNHGRGAFNCEAA